MLGHEHDKRSSCWTLMGDDHNRKSGRRVWDECRIGSFPPIGSDLFPSLDRPTFGLPWQAERTRRAWATLLASRAALGREESGVYAGCTWAPHRIFVTQLSCRAASRTA